SDVHIELLGAFGQLKRLTNDHAGSFPTEEDVDAAIVDGDVASTRTQEDPSGGGFTAASAVVLCNRHSELLLDLEVLVLLSSMWMSCTFLQLHLAIQPTTQGVPGQHALDC